MRVVIAGGGNVGRYLATDLGANDHDVLVVESDAAVVGRAKAEGAPGVRWMVGDACEYSTLAEAGLEAAEVVVAVTGDDEDNLVVSLLAKQEFAVPRVIARVNNPKNEWLFNESWGIDISVSTPHLLTALVEEAVSVGSLVRLLQLKGAKARLVEVTLADQSPAVNRTVGELALPRDSVVVAVVRGDRIVMPRGDTGLQAADEVLVLVTPDAEAEVKTRLVGR